MQNQGTKEDDSQSDPHPEVGPSVCQSRHSIDSDTDKAHDMVTGGLEEIRQYPDMVRGVTGEIRQYPDMVTTVQEETHNGHHMVTEIQEETPYCCNGTSSGKKEGALHKSVTSLQWEYLCDN